MELPADCPTSGLSLHDGGALDSGAQVKVYVGQTRGKEWISLMESHGFGEMVVRGEMPPRRKPWAFDNGAYRDWTAGRGFDAVSFLEDLETIWRYDGRPDFIVVPDMVAGGMESLRFSMHWMCRPELRRHKVPLYLAVQDGMTPVAVMDDLRHFQGIFVGGTLDFKLKSGRDWVDLAHQWGIPCHIGRAGTENRVKWARRLGATSIDSCLPLWSEENLARFSEDCTPASMSSGSEAQSAPLATEAA